MPEESKKDLLSSEEEKEKLLRSIKANDHVAPQDFILISEFSELEGPLPLAVVSEHFYFDLKDQERNTRRREEALHELGLQDFDFNAFVLRIVSVDQTSDEFEHPDLEATAGMFSIPDDTQVYTTDAENQFFAFTHHLALFDINARGYVHPVALSYITCDPEKIVWRFEDFSERFNEVSRLMKKGNFSNFALDLKCRLMDLEYTQKRISHDEEKAQCNISVEAMQQAITVTRLMIDTVESYLVQLPHESIPELLSEYSSTTGGSGSRKASDGFILPATPNSLPETPTSENIAKQHEGSVFPLLALMPQGHEDQVKCLFEEQRGDYEPKFVDTLHPVAHFERKLRSLAQLCQEPKQQQQQQQQLPYQKRTSLPATVIPLVSAIEPPRNNSSSSVEDEEQLKPTFASTITQDMYAEAIKYMTEMTHDFGYSSEILDLIEDEEMYLQPPSGVLLVGRTFVMNMKNPQLRQQQAQQQQAQREPIMTNEEERNESEQEEEEESSLPEKCAHSILWHHHDYDSEDATSQSPGVQHLETLNQLGDTLPHLIFALLTGRPVVVMSDVCSKQRVQNTVRALSAFVPSQPKKPTSSTSTTTQQQQQQQQQPDMLLCHWFEKDKLTDTELDSIKLVGAAKASIDASIYKLDISCLDISDERHPNLVTSPLYLDGYWINQIVDRLQYFTSDKSWFAYLQTVFMAMALKAYIYHHMYSMETQRLSSTTVTSLTAAAAAGLDELNNNNFKTTTSKSDYWDSSSSEGSGLTKKWSVRRIMSYLRRIEEREDGANNSEALTTVVEDKSALDPIAAAAAAPPPTSILPPSSSSSDVYHNNKSNSKWDDDEAESDESSTDGMTLNERRGRRFLEQKLGIHGDDQNIVIYFSSSIL